MPQSKLTGLIALHGMKNFRVQVVAPKPRVLRIQHPAELSSAQHLKRLQEPLLVSRPYNHPALSFAARYPDRGLHFSWLDREIDKVRFLDLVIEVVREGGRTVVVSIGTIVNGFHILLLLGENTLRVSSGSHRAKSWYNAHSTD